MNLKYTKNFSNPRRFTGRLLYSFGALSRKQKLSLAVFMFCGGFMFVRAQLIIPAPIANWIVKSVVDVVSGTPATGGVSPGMSHLQAVQIFIGSFAWLDIVKSVINYIVVAQNKSISTVAGMQFGSSSMFSTISSGLTIFAVIACAYKIVTHYMNTERYDSVKAFTGFFSYFGVLLLFIFSGSIVNRVAGLNSSINKSAVVNIAHNIDSELDSEIKKDAQALTVQLEALDKIYTETSITEVGAIISNRVDYMSTLFLKFYLGNVVKYFYFTFFSLILVSVLSIPTFIMAFMVKVLLSVMIAGTKLVFLLAFVPGFENTWKTFMLNLVNVLLWIPIFNAMMAFIIAIVSGTMISGSMGSGQIVWLSIVAVVCAFQSVSLTTTAAGTIINGVGAGMAGAMGGLASMNAASVAGKAIGAGASVAGTAAGVSMGKFKK